MTSFSANFIEWNLICKYSTHIRTLPLLIADDTSITTDVFAGRKHSAKNEFSLYWSLASLLPRLAKCWMRLQELFRLYQQADSGRRRKTISRTDRLTLRLAKIGPIVSSKMSVDHFNLIMLPWAQRVLRRGWGNKVKAVIWSTVCLRGQQRN